MAVKGRLLQPSASVATLSQIIEKPGAKKALAIALNFVLGFAMACVRVMGSLAPFGVAMAGRAGTDAGGLSCLAGACLGYMLTGSFDRAVRYIAAMLLIFTVAYVFRRVSIGAKLWFMPLTVGIITAVTAFLASFRLIENVPDVVSIFSEVVLAAGATYFFNEALTPQKTGGEEAERLQTVSVLVLCACLLMSLVSVNVANVVSLGRFMAVILVLTASFKGGMLPGCAAGTALGMAMDMAAGTNVFFVMAYAFAGLVSGAFSKHGRLLFLISYILANAVAVLWTWGFSLRLELLYEVFAATVVFAILPDRFLEFLGSFAQLPIPATGESGLRRYAAQRAARVGDAFRDLYGTVFRSLESKTNDNDIATVFDRAAASVCVNCKNKEDCWQTNFMDTLSVMNDATAAMLERGRLTREDLAERFLDKCAMNHSFISAVNAELRSMTYRKQFKNRLDENRTAAYGQYRELADIIDGVARELVSARGADPLAERRLRRFLRTIDVEAEVSVFRDSRGRLRTVIESGSLRQLYKHENYMELISGILGVRLCRPPSGDGVTERRLELLEAEPLTASVGIAGMKKKGEPISGDRGTYFKTDSGVLCVILADGMGSGTDAARESINAVRTLEGFLRAGVDPAVAMKMLNSVLLLKNGEEWGYSTIDLMCIDLFTGETCFYKYGAAPSFVKNGKVIRRVRGESLAAGLCAGEGSAPDIVRMKLRPGNVAIIASDGVVAESRDGWLREILAHDDGSDTKALATDTLRAAVRQYGSEDDMTVLAVRVDERM
jgi:stage II sporulation protein E